MKIIRLFIRKIICLVLSFIMLITGSPISFAQEITKEIKYMPAISFNYEFFTIDDGGKIIPGQGKYSRKTIKTDRELNPEEEFIAKLIADMDDNQDEDPVKPNSLKTKSIPRSTQDRVDRVDYFGQKNNRFNSYNPQLISNKPVLKAYNDFMHYNFYPTESPYWKWTAFVPDNEASEEDVLLILDKHKQLTEEILDLFETEEEYRKDKLSRNLTIAIGIIVLVLVGYFLWEVAPLIGVSKWISMPVLFGLDILFSDYIAYKLRTLDNSKDGVDDVEIKISMLGNMEKRNMLKSQIESEHVAICEKAEK